MHTSNTSIKNINSLSLNPLPHTKIIKHTSHIRRKLNTSPDKTQVRCIFINVDILELAPRQSQGTG